MKISYSELKQCTDEMHSVIETVNEIFENVSSISNQIVRSECWIGAASDLYVNKLKSITSCFDELYSEFNKSALYLDKVISGYEDTDSKVVSASNRIGTGIGSIAQKTFSVSRVD